MPQATWAGKESKELELMDRTLPRHRSLDGGASLKFTETGKHKKGFKTATENSGSQAAKNDQLLRLLASATCSRHFPVMTGHSAAPRGWWTLYTTSSNEFCPQNVQ